MSVTIEELADGKALSVRLSGKLQQEDYDRFVPETERLIQKHGKVRLLVELEDFHGWEAAALWEDVKFDAKHFNDIERLAIVGEKRWHHGMAVFCKPFTTAEIRYFDQEARDEAARWILEGIEAGSAAG